MADDPANYGDAARRVMARGQFVVKELGQDLRVLEHYRQWYAGRELPVVLGQMWTTMTPQSMRAVIDPVWQPASDAELLAVARLLREDMGIRFRQEEPYPWAAPALIMVLQTAANNDAAPPDEQQSVEVKLEGLSGIPAGRFPRHDGKEIRRDVAWCYRALIKHPPDSIAELTQEYSVANVRPTDPKATGNPARSSRDH